MPKERAPRVRPAVRFTAVSAAVRPAELAKRCLSPVGDRQIRAGARRLDPPGDARTFLLPSDAPGSMGDEAMVRSVLSVAESTGLTNVHAISTRTGSHWPDLNSAQHYFMPWLYRTLPGHEARTFGSSVSGADHFVWLAADTIDGGHDSRHLTRTVSALHAWAERGARVSVVNFSLRGETLIGRETLRLLTRASNVVVRDQISARFLRQQIDCAFTVAPDVAYALIDAVTPASDIRSRPSFGLNLSGHAVEKEGASDLVSVVTHALAGLDGDLSAVGFELIPHDVRTGLADDRPFLEQVHRALHHEGVASWFAPGSLPPAALRRRLATMPLVLTSRMHLAIAALSVGAIPICLTYFHDKFAGQMDLFGLPPWLLIPAGDATPASVREVLTRAYAERQTLQAIIEEALPGIREHSRRAIVDYLTP
jgi:polysaccharide pyruvyl transferase WcaK-like protein